jgi:hypothetical protein
MLDDEVEMTHAEYMSQVRDIRIGVFSCMERPLQSSWQLCGL